MKFTDYLLGRLFYSIFVLIGLSILIFVIARMLPGDPARLALGPFASGVQVAKLRHEMGMDKPIYLQYVDYIKGVLKGDMGKSFQTRRNVALDIQHFLPATLELVGISIIWVIIIGIPFGLLAGRYKDSWFDNVSRLVAFIGVAIPPFVAGLLGQLIFSYGLGILPTTGRLSLLTVPPPERTGFYLIDSLLAGNLETFWDAFVHILLPSFSVALIGIGQITRITRSSVSDVLSKDYIQFCKTLGIPNRLITFKYMLRPSFTAPLTIIGLTFASELGNAFLVEQVFGWPGMAKYGIRAILRKDFNAVMGVVMVIGLAFVIVNLIVDLVSGFIDPRIRLKESSNE
ncbi:MAG: ABC transporter permease [Spirochaetes bacterium]|nr:MAG: ABC transporter permease [Spirochaetota bacterium]